MIMHSCSYQSPPHLLFNLLRYTPVIAVDLSLCLSLCLCLSVCLSVCLSFSPPSPPPPPPSLLFSHSMQHSASNPQPHPAVLPHLQHFETPDMAQSGGCPQEALGTGWNTAADCGLRLTHWTEDLVWPGIQKKKKFSHACVCARSHAHMHARMHAHTHTQSLSLSLCHSLCMFLSLLFCQSTSLFLPLSSHFPSLNSTKKSKGTGNTVILFKHVSWIFAQILWWGPEHIGAGDEGLCGDQLGGWTVHRSVHRLHQEYHRDCGGHCCRQVVLLHFVDLQGGFSLPTDLARPQIQLVHN